MFSNIAAPIVSLLNSLVGPLLMIVGALGTIYCIILGVKYAKADEPQEREKAKSSLVNSVIGFVLIFVLILALNLLMPTMVDWVNTTVKETTNTEANIIPGGSTTPTPSPAAQ